MKTTVGVIFGGRSGEHEVSVRSAGNVIESLNAEKYDVVPIAIDHEGRWLDPARSASLLSPAAQKTLGAGREQFAGGEIGLVPDPRAKGLTVLGRDGSDSRLRLDVIIPVLHGTFGEDGTIQGLLELANLPYVGCGVLASSCGMDKIVMKSLFHAAGLPMCRYAWFSRAEWETDGEAVLERIEREIGYPSFVKPANLGSSVGVSRAADRDSLTKGIDLACEYDSRIIVEEGLEMREIECAILGNSTPEASLPGEYVIKDKSKTFLDYEEKYAATGNNEFVVPAPISDELSNRVREMAVTAFKAIDGSGLARVDFFLIEGSGELLINEINTMPGLTDASGFPKMWAGSGVAFSEVLDRLIELAGERHADRGRNRTSLND